MLKESGVRVTQQLELVHSHLGGPMPEHKRLLTLDVRRVLAEEERRYRGVHEVDDYGAASDWN